MREGPRRKHDGERDKALIARAAEPRSASLKAHINRDPPQRVQAKNGVSMQKRGATFLHRRTAAFLGPLAILATTLLAAWGGLASAAGTRAGGEVHAYQVDPPHGNVGRIILTGAITDHGTDHEGVAGGGSFNKIVLSKGSFEINVSHVGNVPVDPKTCVSAGSASGGTPIVKGSGTGAYRGIRGTFQTTVTAASLLPRKNDKCNTSATRGYPAIFMAKASGTVSYK